MSSAIDGDPIRIGHETWRKNNKYKIHARVPVLGIGNSVTPLAMILGCAPGAEDTLADEPFSDPAGRVLRQLANSVGLNKTNTWVTTLFKYKFPNNRLPFADEAQAVRHLLYLEWCEVNKPQLIITVGPTATDAVLGLKTARHAKSGQAWVGKSKCGLAMAVMPMVHPMHGLRDEGIRAIIDKHWCDLGAALALSRKEAADKAQHEIKRYLRKEFGTGHDYASS